MTVLIISSAMYGMTMKIADLLDEHGLKWFKGSAMLFGLAWGIFGLIFALTNEVTGTLVLAMNIAFILRGRLDYPNHQLAATIIILGILYNPSSVIPNLLIVFFLIFLVFGGLKDVIDDTFKLKSRAKVLTESMLYYPIPTFLLCYFFGYDWTTFWGFLTAVFFYNTTKLIFGNKGYC